MCFGQIFRLMNLTFIFVSVHAARFGGLSADKNRCDTYLAWRIEKTRDEPQRCECRVLPYPSQSCGGETGEYGTFSLKGILDPDSCSCLGLPEQRPVPVQVAALHFCADAVKKYIESPEYFEEQRDQMKADLKPELCEEILVGTVKNESWLASAAKLSTHSGAKGLGHLDPLVTQSVHRELLAQVCHDECKKLVKETKKEMVTMYQEREGGRQAVQACADKVVRKVEAEILGCCGRSCGWNNRTCTSWPFFSRKEKVDWLEECCTEYNVLEGSSRERMCNSVLTPGQVALVSEFETHAREGTDVGGPYIGQDPPLLWRAKGIKQFRKELMKLKTVPKEKDVVDSDFLEKHPDVREKGLEEHWFEEEKVSEEKAIKKKIRKKTKTKKTKNNKEKTEKTRTKKKKKTNGPSSFAETNQCTSKKLIGMDKCQKNPKMQVLKTCMRKGVWQFTDRPPEKPDEFDPSCKMIGTDKAQRVETPDDCLKIPQKVFGDVGTIKRRFFLYDNPAKDTSATFEKALPNPILCHVESEKYQCNNEFDRNDLNMNVLGNRGFDELLYWVDESEVKQRVAEIPKDKGRVVKELKQA